MIVNQHEAVSAPGTFGPVQLTKGQANISVLAGTAEGMTWRFEWDKDQAFADPKTLDEGTGAFNRVLEVVEREEWVRFVVTTISAGAGKVRVGQ